jgi:hypothetical protein
MKREQIYGLAIAGLAAVILWLLSKKGLLFGHESVGACVGGLDSKTGLPCDIVSSQGTITPDPQTGLPRYDTRYPQTVPEQEAFAIEPLGARTKFDLANGRATCPIGYQLWVNEADGRLWCLPT